MTNLLLLMPKFNFWKEEWLIDLSQPKFRIFRIFKLLNFKFCNLWGNLDSKIFILDICFLSILFAANRTITKTLQSSKKYGQNCLKVFLLYSYFLRRYKFLEKWHIWLKTISSIKKKTNKQTNIQSWKPNFVLHQTWKFKVFLSYLVKV